MRRVAFFAVALFAPAPAAEAASHHHDHGCYLAKQPVLTSGQQIVARADGFTPGATVTFSFPTGPVAVAQANAQGTATTAFNAPGLSAPHFQATRTLTASDGTNQASWVVSLRLLAADFLPSTTQNALTQKVRFYVYGFGPLLTATNRSTSQDVYMHVFQPGGKLRGTFKVGRTHGACGDLTTARRKILPFGLKNGTWTYRFTTKKRYSAKSQPQSEVGFRVTTVFRPSG